MRPKMTAIAPPRPVTSPTVSQLRPSVRSAVRLPTQHPHAAGIVIGTQPTRRPAARSPQGAKPAGGGAWYGCGGGYDGGGYDMTTSGTRPVPRSSAAISVEPHASHERTVSGHGAPHSHIARYVS